MNKFLRKVLISKDVETLYSEDIVRRLLSDSAGEGFRIRNINSSRYKFLANFSFGTGIVQGAPGLFDGISIYGEIKSGSKSLTTIRLTSRMRGELILLTVVWVILTIFQFIGNEIPWWVSLILFPIIIFWFGFIYRMQENSLMKKIEKKLRAPNPIRNID